MRRLTLLTVLVMAVPALAGCGGDGSAQAPNSAATVLLDASPNAVHSGVYLAIDRGYDDALGLNLRARAPTATTNPIGQLTTGFSEFAILDIHDLALARERGRDLVGVMAVVQTPLTAVMALPQIRSPRDLAGRRVGISGRPGEAAALGAIVRAAGGDPATLRAAPIGDRGTRNLLAGNVAATTGYWSDEGTALQSERPQIREFRVDDFGAPAFPQLVLTVTRETLQDRPSLVRATIATIARGYEEVLSDPENGISSLQARVKGLDRARLLRQLDVVSPSFTAGPRGFGYLSLPALRTWARWEQRVGITKRVVDANLAFDGRYVPRPGRD